MPSPAGVRRSDPLAASLTFAATAGLFLAGGWWLDRQWGTVPLFLIIGLLVGFAAGMLHILTAVAPELLPFGKASSSKEQTSSDLEEASPDSGEASKSVGSSDAASDTSPSSPRRSPSGTDEPTDS